MKRTGLPGAGLLILLMAIAGCDGGEPARARPDGSAALHAAFDAYFEEALALDPLRATAIGDHRWDHIYPNDIAPAWRARRAAMHRRWLERVEAIPAADLDAGDRFSRELFLRERRQSLQALEFPDHLIPVSQLFNPMSRFAQMGSGRGIHPFRDTRDYDNFLSRIDGFVAWVDQAIVNMREGMRRGIVQPRVVMVKVLPQLDAHVVDDPRQSIFWRPVRDFPDTVSPADRERLRAAFREAIVGRLVPAYARMRAFIADEYLPACRESDGWGALPDGDRWYRFLVRRYTTTGLSPEEIHDLGLREVERIQRRMREVAAGLGWEGDLQGFFAQMAGDPALFFSSREEILSTYRGLKARVRQGLPALFGKLPAADFEIRPIESFRERAAPAAHYQRPSADGARPAVFYINTFRPRERPRWRTETLYLHEAEPGHHFQIARQQELTDLPRFRRFGGYTAYSEGWALYAEGLGHELGMFRDPYQLLGHLDAELWRAVRLVVDTGLHARGWSRQQVLDYMYANAPVTRTRAVAEAERYMVLPAQALSYKIGQLRILALREEAERALGDDFDLAAFHEQVIGGGALPMDFLERRIRDWIAAGRGG